MRMPAQEGRPLGDRRGSHVNRLNTFELILVDRSDTGVGNFDIEFNYNTMQWETGDASGGSGGIGGISAAVGYSNGISGASNIFFQLPGSLVNGALINGGPNALISNSRNSRNSTVPGRYYFQVRNGAVVSNISLLDPVSQLLNSSSGTGIISDPFNSTLAKNTITTRLGVAADGVAKLVVRFSASTAGMVAFTLTNASGIILPSNPGENGALTDLQGIPLEPLDGSRAIATVSNSGQKAFAIYTAPTRFADDSGIFRSVYIKTTFSPTAGVALT